MWIEYTHLSQFSPKTLLKMMVKEPKKKASMLKGKEKGSERRISNWLISQKKADT